MDKRADKFERGYIGVRGWSFNVSDVLVYATADEADAYMFYTCFFLFFLAFRFFHSPQKIPDNCSRERLNGRVTEN